MIMISIMASILVVMIITIVAVALKLHSRKSTKEMLSSDSSYSILRRGTAQQLKPQILTTPDDFYDKIQLSPSTGQAELISTTESESVHSTSQNQHDIYPCVDTKQPQDVGKSTASEQPTYAVINKEQEKKNKSGKLIPQSQNIAKIRERGFNKTDQIVAGQTQPLEQLYTAIMKSPKCSADKDEEAPPIPPHTVEELYTAVARKSGKWSLTDIKEDAPPITPYKVEDVYRAVHEKKAKDSTQEDEEDLPPIPPHTVEELYTAVVKKTSRQ